MLLPAIVVAGNVRLILTRTRVPLVSIHVYRPAIVPISHASVVPLLLVVRAGYGEPGHLTLSLLLARELAIVNTDRYSDVFVKGVRSVYLVQLILNALLKAVVEELHQSFVVNLGPDSVLPKDCGVRRGRLGLLESCEPRLRVQLLVYVAEHLL